MELLPLEDFKSSQAVQYGTVATSFSVNKAPIFIKNELNNLYNYVSVNFGELPLAWDSRMQYKSGDIVSSGGKIYSAVIDNINMMPENADWKLYSNTNILSNKFISYQSRDSYNTLFADKDNVTALMTPKNGLVPWDNANSSDLGTVDKKFNTIYTSSIETTDVHIVNADIAEKYESDFDYDAGTVLGFGGNKEVTLYNKTLKVAGVVSTNPAYMLNSENEGIYIALKGRVPCKINGDAKRGQYIIADDNGLGITVDNYTFEESRKLLGIAISDSSNSVVEIKV